MSLADAYRRELATLMEKEASLRKELNRHKADEAKALEEERKKMSAMSRTSSPSMIRSYATAAERERKKAIDAGKKIADVTSKMAQNAKTRASKTNSLQNAERNEQQASAREDDRRRRKELDHARQVSRLSAAPLIRHIAIREPEPEKLRVLYLTSNPGLDLRTEQEVRQVQQALRGAKYRDLVEVQQRPAATFQDLLDGLNDIRPHIVHFSGHSGGEAVQFNSEDMVDSCGIAMNFSSLVHALAATDQPPELLVLNSCESLDGALVLLPAVPVIIGMSDAVSDTAAIIFSQQFYAAIAAGQSVGSALKQGKAKIKAVLLDDDAAELPSFISRNDIEIERLILVKSKF